MSKRVDLRARVYYRTHPNKTLFNIATYTVANIIDKCNRKKKISIWDLVEKTNLPTSIVDCVHKAIFSFHFYDTQIFKIWKPNKNGELEFKNNYKIKIKKRHLGISFF
jgi:dTDP-glucose pyrophosphorylase